MIDFFKTFWQYLIPQHGLSNLVHWLMNLEQPWLSHFIIRLLVSFYHIDLSEAERQAVEDYRSVNDFFTRGLRSDARPIDSHAHSLVAPVDGTISQAGRIDGNLIIQAKGDDFTLEAILGGDIALAEQLHHGDFAVIYLSPRDYHRVHMPIDGQLHSMTYVPGDLFAVNPATVRMVPDLYARNERLVIRFSTDIGPVVLVMVGAIFVGSMQTVWQGKVTPAYGKCLRHWDYRQAQLHFKKGEEIGQFNLGSTVILLLPKGQTTGFSHLAKQTQVRMGQVLTHRVTEQKIAKDPIHATPPMPTPEPNLTNED